MTSKGKIQCSLSSLISVSSSYAIVLQKRVFNIFLTDEPFHQLQLQALWVRFAITATQKVELELDYINLFMNEIICRATTTPRSFLHDKLGSLMVCGLNAGHCVSPVTNNTGLFQVLESDQCLAGVSPHDSFSLVVWILQGSEQGGKSWQRFWDGSSSSAWALWGVSSPGNAGAVKGSSQTPLCTGCKQAGQPTALSAPSCSVQGRAWWSLGFRTQVFVLSQVDLKKNNNNNNKMLFRCY